eukprot:GEZU01018100.1.p1 GENE.GEZU01018100.1~~GEZU01018100.1.p1  ORF type:complete len:369 (-),score=43.82 GEZU01018100.1:58-1122(-)
MVALPFHANNSNKLVTTGFVPNELLYNIFSFLASSSIIRSTSLVSKQWHHVSRGSIRCVEALTEPPFCMVQDGIDSEFLTRFLRQYGEGIEKLDLMYYDNNGNDEEPLDDLAFLKYLTRLSWLSLKFCQNIDIKGAMQHIGSLTTIEHLNLSSTPLQIEDWTLLPTSLTNLTTLNLDSMDNDYASLDDEDALSVGLDGIKHICSSFPKLKSLSIRGWKPINDACLEVIAKDLPLLERLDLSECTQITDAGIAHLVALPIPNSCSTTSSRLQHLFLGSLRLLTDDCVPHLCGMKRICTLRLSHTYITEEGLVELARCLTNLVSIDLRGCDVMPERAREIFSHVPNVITSSANAVM